MAGDGCGVVTGDCAIANGGFSSGDFASGGGGRDLHTWSRFSSVKPWPSDVMSVPDLAERVADHFLRLAGGCNPACDSTASTAAKGELAAPEISGGGGSVGDGKGGSGQAPATRGDGVGVDSSGQASAVRGDGVGDGVGGDVHCKDVSCAGGSDAVAREHSKHTDGSLSARRQRNADAAEAVYSTFYASSPPKISLHDYMKRFVTYANPGVEALLLLCIFVKKLTKDHPGLAFGPMNVHRFTAAGLLLGAKVSLDKYFNNVAFAKVAGLNVQALNRLEVSLFQLLGWRLYASNDELLDCYVMLSSMSATDSALPVA
eukprot:m.45482 g.45482  ORF g.45482 m.45482 type:complete len:316 (+) comp11783_c0_seq1:190-1137(+)